MFARRFGLLLAIGTLAGCASLQPSNVVAGALTAAQGFFISDQQEIQIGQETKLKVLAEMPEYPNPQVRDYVTTIGKKMVAQSERSTLAFEFHVIDSAEINAFAAPGGFLFVTTGALRLMTNEAQLAGVIGHEVAHVAKKHSIKGIQETLIAQGAATAVLGKDSDKLVQTAANIGASLILKGFDRGKEEEADKEGARYAYKSGYDPRELGSFLDSLSKATGETPTWLIPVADHPRSDDRIKGLAAFMTSQGFDVNGKALNAADYKANVLDRLPAAPAPTPTPATQ
jgi:predicted Zn-dependent protease